MLGETTLELICLFIAGLFREFIVLISTVNLQEEIAAFPNFDYGNL